MVKKLGSFVAFLALTTVVPGCREGSGPSTDAGLWQLEIRESIGDEGRIPLAHVYRLAIHPEGSVAIADGPPARVLLIRDDGRTLQIGGPGAGPSEYSYVNEVGFIGDTLWVTDARNSKAVFFDLEGELLGTERVAVDAESRDDRPAGPLRPLADGSWLASVPAVSITGVMSGWISSRVFHRVEGGGAVPVFVQPLPKEDYLRIKLGEQRFLEGQHPLPSRPLFLTGLDGRSHIVVDRPVAPGSESASFQVHRIDLHGDTLWSRTLSYEPIPLSVTWAQDWANAWGERLEESMELSAARIAAAFLEHGTLPDFFPPVMEAQAGLDGRIWIRESRLDTMDVRWLVLDSLGEVQGRIKAPGGFRLMLPDSSDVYGVVMDEFDVETVVRATIVPSGN